MLYILMIDGKKSLQHQICAIALNNSKSSSSGLVALGQI